MNDPAIQSRFVDQYVRNRLNPEEESRFELALLDSLGLQTELQSVLALRELMLQHEHYRRVGKGSLGNADRRRA